MVQEVVGIPVIVYLVVVLGALIGLRLLSSLSNKLANLGILVLILAIIYRLITAFA